MAGKLGSRQLDILRKLGGLHLILLTPDKATEGLRRRGLVSGEEGRPCHITSDGLRALADAVDQGRVAYPEIDPEKRGK